MYQWEGYKENKRNICFLTYNMGSGGHNVPLIKENLA